jgi:hypothetical protein
MYFDNAEILRKVAQNASTECVTSPSCIDDLHLNTAHLALKSLHAQFLTTELLIQQSG